MSGVAHHLVKRGLEATHDRYRSQPFGQDGDDKPFGHPHAVAAALVITAVAWFLVASAVSHDIPFKRKNFTDHDNRSPTPTAAL